MSNQLPKSWIFLFLAVIGLLIGLYVTSPQPSEKIPVEQLPETSRAITFDDMLSNGNDAIYIENQTAEQTQVVIGYVVLSRPGYVVIYDDHGGIPGEKIGVSEHMEEGGEHMFMRVDEPFVDGEIYYAMLWHDNGDGIYRESTDMQVVDSTDSVVLMTFEAIAGVEPEIEPIHP
jgi:hypothetical protein